MAHPDAWRSPSIDGMRPPGADEAETEPTFDFDAHRKAAVDKYQGVQRDYEDCARAVYSVLKTALDAGESSSTRYR